MNCFVESIEVGTDTSVLRTSSGDIATRWVINAAGLGGDVIDRMLGYDRFTIVPRRGELFVFDKLTRPMANTIVLPVPTEKGKGVLISPTIFGNVMLGPTSENLVDRTDTSTSEEGFAFLLTKGAALMPSLINEEVTASYAGLRAFRSAPQLRAVEYVQIVNAARLGSDFVDRRLQSYIAYSVPSLGEIVYTVEPLALDITR